MPRPAPFSAGAGRELGVSSASKVSEREVFSMEAHLERLRMDMAAEKEKRTGDTSIWSRGQVGRLHNYKTGKDLPRPPGRTKLSSVRRGGAELPAPRSKPRTPSGEPAPAAAAHTVAAVAADEARHQQHDYQGYAHGTSGGTEGAQVEVFDEAESRRSFLDALNEWRSGGTGGGEASSGGNSSAPEPAAVASTSTAVGSSSPALLQSSHKPVRPATYFTRLAISKEAKLAGAEAATRVKTDAGDLASDAIEAGRTQAPPGSPPAAAARKSDVDEVEAGMDAHEDVDYDPFAPPTMEEAPAAAALEPNALDPHTAPLDLLLDGEEMETAQLITLS